jgi:hypothetical protein
LRVGLWISAATLLALFAGAIGWPRLLRRREHAPDRA